MVKRINRRTFSTAFILAPKVLEAQSAELTVEQLCAGAEYVLRENQDLNGQIGAALTTIYAAKALLARGIDLRTVSKEGGVSLFDNLVAQAKEFIATPVPTLMEKWDPDRRSLETTWGSRLMWVLNPITTSDPYLLGDLVSHTLAVVNVLLRVEARRTNFIIYTLLGLKNQDVSYTPYVNILRERLFEIGNTRDGWPEFRGEGPELDHTAAAFLALNVTSGFFTNRRNPDGGFGSIYQGESNIDTTSWAAMTGTAPPNLHFYRLKLQRYGALAHWWYGSEEYCHHCIHEDAQLWSTSNALLALTRSGSAAYS